MSAFPVDSAVRSFAVHLVEKPTESIILRMARAAAGFLPRGRSAFVRSVARATGRRAPFFANVDWAADIARQVIAPESYTAMGFNIQGS